MAANTPPGPGVDASGQAVIDPTKNVLDFVRAETKRQDDLRSLESRWMLRFNRQQREHDKEIRKAESERIDANRATDTLATQQAAVTQTNAAAALATQLAATAEASRNQVAAAAEAYRVQAGAQTEAQTSAVLAVVAPIQRDIRDVQADIRSLREEQSRGQGGKEQTVMDRDDRRPSNSWVLALVGVVVAVLLGLGAMFLTVVGLGLTIYLATK